MAKQLRLELQQSEAFGKTDYFTSDANMGAVRMIEAWRDWPDQRCILIGPKGSGKSHLGHIWSQDAQAKIMDTPAENRPSEQAIFFENVERFAGNTADEEAIFHLLNACALSGTPLLLSASAAPKAWGVKLPDLLSRLQAMTIAKLEPPDDDLMLALLAKQFSDRGLHVKPNVLDYLILRLERDYHTIRTFVSSLDDASLERGREITVNLARELLPESET